MKNNAQKKLEIHDPIMLCTFSYLPYVKKDSREKIIKALDDVVQIEERLRPI